MTYLIKITIVLYNIIKSLLLFYFKVNLSLKRVQNRAKKRGHKKGPKWPKSRVQKPLFFKVLFHGAHAVKIGSKMDFFRNFPAVKHALPL
jgi:hypothetical protein